MKLMKKISKLITEVVNPLAQSQYFHNPEKTITPGMPEILRDAAAQGAVLLETGFCPLKRAQRLPSSAESSRTGSAPATAPAVT